MMYRSRGADLATGSVAGLAPVAGGLRLERPVGVIREEDPWAGGTFVGEFGWWRSEFVACEPFTELVPSWGADCPPGTWLRVEARVRTDDGRTSAWLPLARWAGAEPPNSPTRTSLPGPGDDIATADTDTVSARAGVTLVGWQLQITVVRTVGAASPTLQLAGAVTSGTREIPSAASEPTVRGVEVGVPTYTQRAHLGRYPRWDGGGASWCSATSLAMALDALGVGPTDDELAWVEPGPRPQVVHAVRGVFDAAYGGAGNWSFNAAHAWARGVDAHVGRARDLTDLEPRLAQGLPVVVSTRFTREELPQAGYATGGHLMLLVGIDDAGDPVLHDPNSHLLAEETAVRTVYPRLAFEQAMARTGGACYLLDRRP